ncbi:MAG: hypothetical protein ACOX02_02630 [Acholeplasmatales bacterium]
MELGVDYIIDGGQTMNPPTEDFIKAVEAVNADNIIILPNNGNVILTAEQTLDLIEDANIRVLRTKTIGQGYAAMMVYDTSNDIDDNLEAMSDVVSEVKTGELTYSIRDTEVNGVKIKKDDFIGITGGKIVVSDKDRKFAIKALIESILDEDAEILTLFYGKDVSDDEAKEIRDHVQALNSEVEVELINGKQDIYSYIVSVE